MPRAGLTTARVVQEASDVADEVGLAHLTLTAIAPRLGVAMPSLYKHVAGMDALQRLVSIDSTRQLSALFARAAAGKAGADALRAICTAWRAWAKEHPGRYAATVRAPQRDDAEHIAACEEALSVVLAVLASYQFRGDRTIDAARVFRASVHGFISLEQAGGFGLPVDIDRSFDRLVDSLAATFTTWATRHEGATVR